MSMVTMTYIANSIEIGRMAQSMLRGVVGLALVEGLPYEPLRTLAVGTGGKKHSSEQPRNRKYDVLVFALRLVSEFPGLCTQRLNQNEVVQRWGGSLSSLKCALHNGKKKGYFFQKEQAGLGGWYITNKGRKRLAVLTTAIETGERARA